MTTRAILSSKVDTFLGSIGRKSVNTRKSYYTTLIHLKNFIEEEYSGYNSESIIDAMFENKVNVYQLLDSFITYIQTLKPGITANSIGVYVAGLRSYFSYHDVDIIPSKFKRKVMLPKVYREDEQALDSSDIRKLLLNCSNRRLKTYLLVLASGAMRTVEALAIRNKDIDFATSPCKIHLRKEYSKTRVGRDIYISDEATQELKQWLDFKYHNPDKPRELDENDLIFTVYRNASRPHIIYQKIVKEFQRLLKKVGMDQLKESGINGRRKITLHSLRRHAKTVIATQTNSDYSEYYLGHSHSPYWNMKESERREIYATKIMKYLTFLDYSGLEASGRSIEANLQEKDKEIAFLRERDTSKEDSISNLSDQVMQMTIRMQEQERMIQQLLKK